MELCGSDPGRDMQRQKAFAAGREVAAPMMAGVSHLFAPRKLMKPLSVQLAVFGGKSFRHIKPNAAGRLRELAVGSSKEPRAPIQNHRIFAGMGIKKSLAR